MARKAGGYVNPTHYLIPDRFSTEDGAASANNSPVSAGSASNTVLTCPDGAAELVIYSNQAIYISEAVGFVDYYLVPATTEKKFGLGGMDQVYIRAVDEDATVHYYWNVMI